MSFLLRSYQRGVTKFPYIAQGLQSSVLMASGDAIAQIAVEKKTQFDYKRWDGWKLKDRFLIADNVFQLLELSPYWILWRVGAAEVVRRSANSILLSKSNHQHSEEGFR